MAFVAWLIARRPKVDGFVSLELLMGAVTLWALTAGLDAASVGLDQKIAWAKAEYLGAAFAPTLFFIFVLSFSLQKRWLEWWSGALLALVPTLAVIAAWTNEYHQLIWSYFAASPTEPNSLIYGHGTGFYILAAYDFILLLISLMLLLRIWLKASIPYRRQVTLLLIGALIPLLAGALYALRLNPFPGLDLIPASFLLTGFLFAGGILRFQLFDLMPIAPDALIDNMLDGVIVLDAWDRIAKVNPFAQKLVGSLSKDSIGHPAAEALKFWNEAQARAKNTEEIHAEVLLEPNPPRYLEVHISPLLDRQKNFAGRLVIFRDITERHLTKLKLARNVEELQVVNRISLVVSAGLDMERILRALHEQCSQVAAVDVFYVALCEQNSSLVNIPIYYDDGHFLTGASRDLSETPGLIGSVINSRATLYLPDNEKNVTHPVLKPGAQTRGPARSYVGIPLTVRNQIIGVMSVQNRRPNAFSEEQIRLLERIALQAAIAIENARLYAQEQRLAIIDELTGIYNYRGLIELGNREIERARRFTHPLSVLFFDIDGFRNLNNTYSHTAGNLVLKAVVGRCSSILRSIDVFVRFGGDEFVVLLPETDVMNAEAVAKRLVDVVSASAINTPYGDLRVTISVGVSFLTDVNMDLLALIERANQAEHHSKKSPQAKVNTAPLN
jgi:diguanylate cyclase (GGDEF)-like protein/PAS domain S-box-containing protein